MENSLDIRTLCKLFQEFDPDHRRDSQDDDSDTENDKVLGVLKGPGDIGSKSKPHESSTKEQQKPTLSKNKGIWNSDEVVKIDGQGDSFGQDNISVTSDPRKTPAYEMHYRQSVTTEDIFLQMGNKTPGTASCENLVAEIHLPGDDHQKVQLNLKKQAIDLRSPIHFLYLNLPHPIDPRAGNAKWDRDTEKLIITLKLSRELDAYNF